MNNIRVTNNEAMKNFTQHFRKLGVINDEELFVINLMLEGRNLDAFLLVLTYIMASNPAYLAGILMAVENTKDVMPLSKLLAIGNGDE